MLANESVSINCCLATVSRCGDSLSIPEISHISGREYSRNVRLSLIFGDYVALRVEIHLSLENGSVRFIANCYKHAVGLEDLFLTSLDVSTLDPGNVVVPQYFFHHGVPDEFYFRVLLGTVLHYLTGS